jgi:hypothetical protein
MGKIFKNKKFLFALLILLLVVIPITIYTTTRPQRVTTKAVASSTLTIQVPSSVTVGQQFTANITLNPSQNIVSFVKFTILFDPTLLQAVEITPNTSAFPQTLSGPTISSGSASISLGIGNNPSAAIQTTTLVAKVTFNALAKTTTPTTISFDPAQTQVLSLATGDQPGENVLASAPSTSLTINEAATTPTPTSRINATPTPAAFPTPTPILESTPTPVAVANTPPVCTGLSVSPSASGNAPFSVMLTANGNDSDGTLAKVTFNFGDGSVQDVTAGLGGQTASVQINHTYRNPGNFLATAAFTDDRSGVSQTCSQQILVNGVIAQVTPASTVAPTGDFKGIFGILGGVIIALLGSALLIGL